ncbi:MAG TPA: tetratricopeptide repeat protein [Gammaproteobacteria bacterium]|nr:tetratricopeptide repeat protein [Gammaproteobacteria bacterium]
MNRDPDNPVSLNSLADQLLHQGRIDEARTAIRSALLKREDDVEAHYNLGRVHRASGQLDLAQQSFKKALSIDPAFTRAALGLGQTCYDLGQSSEALHYLEQVVQVDPKNADALCYCGQALADIGHTDLAVEFLRKAIEAAPGTIGYTLAAIKVLQGIEFSAEYPWYEQFLAECLDNPLLIHDAITNVATSLLWAKPAMRDALAADRLDSSHLARLAREPLLLRLLSKTIARSWAFEQFFTKLRLALTQTRDPDHLTLLACVAEQAFNAGYAQYQSDAEAALEQELLQKEAALLTPVELMALASYRALFDVPGAAAVADRRDFPESTQRVIQRTLRDPLREREIKSRIVSLTPIRNAASKRVQAQYEEHPYPRWISMQSVNDRNERLVDEIARHALHFEDPGWPQRPKVLVPGCGTGYHPLSLARKHPETDVLAVDLSRTSLAYAARKQEELKFTNVRFCQADLLCLGELNDRFEYIDCAGVLHHLESPMEGWRVLSSVLKPGGVMRIGLYSELARKTVAAAREKIAAMRIPSTPSAIRHFRHAIMNAPELSELRSLARTTADFYSMGGVRDLIFHVQEHRFDLPTIKQCLETLGLEFGGFLLSDRHIVRSFHALNPARAHWLDLDCWAAFEAQYPNTFYAMYQFYCLTPSPRLVESASQDAPKLDT